MKGLLQRIQQGIFLFVLFVISLQVLIVYPDRLGPSRQVEGQGGAPFDSDGINQAMSGVHLVESQESQREWELFSKSAQGNQSTGRWDLKDVRIQLYNKENPEFIVTGKMGYFEGASQDIVVEGNVRIEAENGYILLCSRAKYYGRRREVLGEGPVRVFGASRRIEEPFELTGSSLRIVVPKSLMYVLGPVHSKRTLKNGSNLILSSKMAQLSSLRYEAEFSDQLHMEINNSVVTGQSARLRFARDQKTLDFVQISGGVVFESGHRRAYANTMEIEIPTQKILLTGNPHVLDGEDEIRGDKITMFEGGKRVRVDKVRAKGSQL